MTNDAHDRKVLAAAGELDDRMNKLTTGFDPDTHRGVDGWALVLDQWVDLFDRAAAGELPLRVVRND